MRDKEALEDAINALSETSGSGLVIMPDVFMALHSRMILYRRLPLYLYEQTSPSSVVQLRAGALVIGSDAFFDSRSEQRPDGLLMARNGLADAVATCPLLGEERT